MNHEGLIAALAIVAAFVLTLIAIWRGNRN
jgi:hypothetical protein